MTNPQPHPDAEGRGKVLRDLTRLEPCRKCGMYPALREPVACPDNKPGCCVAHYRFAECPVCASLATLREERESFRGIAEHNSRAVDEWKAERDEMREGWKRDKVAALNAANEVARLTDALTEIANTDYRGNRSHESQLAYRALATRAAHQGTEP